MIDKSNDMYLAWLNYRKIITFRYKEYLKNILLASESKNDIIKSSLLELEKALKEIYSEEINQNVYEDENDIKANKYIKLEIKNNNLLRKNGYEIKEEFLAENKSFISISARDENGILYGVFHLLRYNRKSRK